MQDDLIKVAKLVLKGELKFTDKMLLALYDSLEEELKDATTCDPSPIDVENEKLDSETQELETLIEEFCKKFDINSLKKAEENERVRLSNIGYPFSGKHLIQDLIALRLGLSESNIKADWHIKYIDDIAPNPVEYVWTVAKLVSADPYVEVSRFYKVVPYYKETSYGDVRSKDPKYFCLYESPGVEDSNTKLVAVYESFLQAGYRIKTQMKKINLLKEYFKK